MELVLYIVGPYFTMKFSPFIYDIYFSSAQKLPAIWST